MNTEKKLSLLPFLTLGLLTGLSLALLNAYKIEFPLWYGWITLFSLMFLLAYRNNASLFQLAITALVTSFLAASPFQWLNSEAPNAILLPLISAYAMNSFHMSYHKDGLKIQYPTLFYAVWDTFTKLAVAALFTGLCWIVLFIWSGLFSVIGINFFYDLFTSIWFSIAASTTFASLGLYIVEQTDTVIRNLRFLLLQICRWLLPMICFIGLLFILAWMLTTILVTRDINLNPYIFSLYSVALIIFINGVYQDSDVESPYGKALTRMINIMIVLFPLITAAILYTIMFPSAKFETNLGTYQLNGIVSVGFNQFNFNLFINSCFLFLYSLSYAVNSLRKRTIWSKSLGTINIMLALLLISTTVLLNNYVFYHAPFNPGKQKHINDTHTDKSDKNRAQQLKKLSKAYASAGITWEETLGNPLVLAIRNDQPQSICQINLNKALLAGIIIDNQCVIISNNKLIKANNYKTLSGDPSKISWKNWFNQWALKSPYGTKPVIVGFYKSSIISVCRAIYKNRLYLGTNLTETNICKIAVNNRSFYPNVAEYLYITIEKPKQNKGS